MKFGLLNRCNYLPSGINSFSKNKKCIFCFSNTSKSFSFPTYYIDGTHLEEIGQVK